MKIKRGLIVAIFLTAALFSSSLFAQGTAAKPSEQGDKVEGPLSFSPIGTAIVKSENANVRGQPSFSGEIITKLKKGETVTLLEEIKLKKAKKGEPAAWFRIALPTNTPVWVHADFVNDATKSVQPKRLNVRAGPGENFSVVARLKKGDAVNPIRKIGDWMEVEAPATAFAFVAAELLDKQTAAPVTSENKEIVPGATPVPAPSPVSPPEVVEVPPAETPQPASGPVVEPVPVPAPAPEKTEPAVATPAPASAPESLPRRMVRREGIVRKAWNIQAPTYFQLESLDRGELINYLHSVEVEKSDDKLTWRVPKFMLNDYVGRRVVVTGEESIDKRWKATPVIEVETIELQQ